MPSRKKHSKSRKGCESCKQRRVKCDEQCWPNGPCAACVIRKTQCIYRSASLAPKQSTSRDHATARHPSQSNPTPPSVQSALGIETNQGIALPSTQDASISDGPVGSSVPVSMDELRPSATIPDIKWADRIQELQLMHFWSTRETLALNINGSKYFSVWKRTSLELMFKFGFVLDIAFALTSIHIATEELDAGIRASHVSQALEYQNRAFTPFSTCLENLSPDNCTAVYTFTCMNMACSTVAGQIPTGNKDQVKTPWQSVLTLYDAIHAMNEISRSCSSWLAGTPFSQIRPFMQGEMPVKPTDFRRPWTQDEIDGIRTSIRRLRGLTGQIAVEKHPIYSKAIAMLDHHFTQSTEYGIGWLAQCGSAFFEDVRREEPVALMILMHWGVVLNSMGAIWWARYSGTRLVEHLSFVLPFRGSGQEWNNAIVWCQNQVAANMFQSQQCLDEVV